MILKVINMFSFFCRNYFLRQYVISSGLCIKYIVKGKATYNLVYNHWKQFLLFLSINS